MAEITFGMIKPDAVQAGHTDAIIKMIKDHDFCIIDKRDATIDRATAERFYAVHKDKPFFDELVTFITSGPVVLLALEKDNAIREWRNLMGATNPAHADEGTIRKRFGTSIGANAVHGSDAQETAAYELEIFFPQVAHKKSCC